MSPAGRPLNPWQAQADLVYSLNRVARPNLIVIAWRWRYEIGLLAAIALVLIALATVVGTIWAIIVILATGAGLIAAPDSRAFLIASAWRMITPHRIRRGCAQAWIHTRDGKLPIIVSTTMRPHGEQVLILCRAGISFVDFERARHVLAAACWARAVRVRRSQRHAQVVVLDVIRRSPGRLPPRPAGHGPDQRAAEPWLTDPAEDGDARAEPLLVG